MGHKKKDVTKSDVLTAIVTPFGFEDRRRNRLSKAELQTVYGFLRGGKGDQREWTMDQLRESTVALCYDLHDTAPAPDDVTRYADCDSSASPGLSRQHAEVIRDVVAATIEDQHAAIEDEDGVGHE